MRHSVTKIINFETAHQLTECYSEVCKRIHGHSYKAHITFEGEINPLTGMIVDFKLIKECLQKIIDKYDHKFFTVESFGMNPTAENMSKDIFMMIKEEPLLKNLITEVSIWETDTCCATTKY
jgi:6-pyruvoyltetrahydropterin/6-carboxytetrahydropterin synthase